MKCRHYAVFDGRVSSQFDGKTLNKTNWEILRTDSQESPYSIEQSVEHYESACKQSEGYKHTAEHIYTYIQQISKKLDVKGQKIISLGVGKGSLEWHLKRLAPDLIVECTDYTENAIEQLKLVFKDVDAAHQFDMLEGDYSSLDTNAIFIMHRVSTEFNSEQWNQIFQKMHDAGISSIIFVPTGLDNLIDMLKEKLRYLINALRGRKNIDCGWLYSESEFLKMFHGCGTQALYHVADKTYFGSTAAFLLERN